MESVRKWVELTMMIVVIIAGMAALFPIYQYATEAETRRIDRLARAVAVTRECEKMSTERTERWAAYVKENAPTAGVEVREYPEGSGNFRRVNLIADDPLHLEIIEKSRLAFDACTAVEEELARVTW